MVAKVKMDSRVRGNDGVVVGRMGFFRGGDAAPTGLGGDWVVGVCVRGQAAAPTGFVLGVAVYGLLPHCKALSL